MKYKLLLFTLVLSLSLSAQKKKNGNIYIDHPAIQVIENLYSAMNANDTLALSKILADNYRGISGSQMNKDAKPQTKSEFIQKSFRSSAITLRSIKSRLKSSYKGNGCSFSPKTYKSKFNSLWRC